MRTFGESLRADRERMHLTQEALGKLLDVSQQTVAQWETGRAQPRRERRQHLLQLLGPDSSLARLISGERPVAFALPEDVPIPPAPPVRNALAEHLPGSLRPYLDGILGMGHNQSRYDYLSPHLVAMVKYTESDRHMVWFRLAPEVLRLAVARQIDESCGRSRERVLVVVHNGPLHHRLAQRVAFEAGTLGVSVIPAHTFAEAATIIMSIEADTPA